MIFNRSATALVAGGSAFVLLLVLGPSVVRAQQQTKEQQRCINTMNKSGQKVLATQGKENSSCVKNAGKNKLSGTAQDCLIADPKLKLSKATQKTIDGENKKCTVVPSFAKTDAATVNAAAQDEEISLTADIFGNPLDTAIIDASVDKIGAACQAAVAKGYEKLTATYAKTFNGCKKDALKNLASNEAAIAACLGDDPKGKIGKAEAKLAATPAKKCVGVDQTTAFPGACSGAANMADCVGSIEARARCRTCQSIALQDGAVTALSMSVKLAMTAASRRPLAKPIARRLPAPTAFSTLWLGNSATTATRTSSTVARTTVRLAATRSSRRPKNAMTVICSAATAAPPHVPAVVRSASSAARTRSARTAASSYCFQAPVRRVAQSTQTVQTTLVFATAASAVV
jgi:hypothetical protein